MSITITRPERVVVFCTNLALKAEHERAVAALEDAQRNAARDAREAGSANVATAAAAVRAIEDEMRGHQIEFTLRGWPRKRWVEFEETHKPRPDHEGDKVLSIDVSSLDEALSSKGDWPLTIVAVKAPNGEDVPFDPRRDWNDLADEMTNGQWEDFALAVLQVNRGVKAAPFSVAASRVIPSSASN